MMRTYNVMVGTMRVGVIGGGSIGDDDGANETIGDVSRVTIGRTTGVTIGARARAAMIGVIGNVSRATIGGTTRAIDNELRTMIGLMMEATQGQVRATAGVMVTGVMMVIDEGSTRAVCDVTGTTGLAV